MIKVRIIKDDEIIVKRGSLQTITAAEETLKSIMPILQKREETARIKARTDRWAMVATVILLLVIICIVGYQAYKENS